MSQEIKPERITKPIQLLGAWLAGLLAIDSCFLIAAANTTPGSWESKALTIAAIANVPVFLLAVFLLQTRFRPELQEDIYYSTYINQKTNTTVQIDKATAIYARMDKVLERLEPGPRGLVNEVITTAGSQSFANLSIGVNFHLDDGNTIIQGLESHGALDIREFGSDEPPNERVVAISPELSRSERSAILNFAIKIGFSRVSAIEIFEEIDEHVLFGAYGESRNILLIPEVRR